VEPAPAGELRDLETIYKDHFDAVWNHLRRLGVAEADRDDLVQEVFLTVHRRLATYDRSRPMRPWLVGIATRVALHHWRSARRRPIELDPGELDRALAANGGDRDAQLVLAALLDTIEPDRRTEFVLHELEGFSVPEIAELVGAPLNTVYSRLRRTREELGRLAQRWHHKEAP
jgi:RNA polymerase sigma-70 factor (ECF subfamily)